MPIKSHHYSSYNVKDQFHECCNMFGRTDGLLKSGLQVRNQDGMARLCRVQDPGSLRLLKWMLLWTSTKLSGT